MDPSGVISLTATGSVAAGYILKRIVDHLLGRGRLRADEATKIRTELREDIKRKDREIEALEQRKDKSIAALERRVASLEEELEKTERERNAIETALAKYKLDVYRTLVLAGADKDLLNSVLAIQER